MEDGILKEIIVKVSTEEYKHTKELWTVIKYLSLLILIVGALTLYLFNGANIVGAIIGSAIATAIIVAIMYGLTKLFEFVFLRLYRMATGEDLVI